MGNFDSKPAYYTTQNVLDIDEWEPDQYGNRWFNVKFEDSSETYLWKAKNKPEEGKEYYGHFESTKSGNSMRFKRDKEPDQSAASNSPKQEAADKSFKADPVKQDNIHRSVALEQAVSIAVANKEKDINNIINSAQEFYNWLTKNTGSESQGAHPPVDRKQSEKSQPARDPEFDDLEPPEDLDYLKEEGSEFNRDWQNLGKNK